jgi:hypothetical protein
LTALLVSIVTRAPSVKVLDLEVKGQVFVRMLCIRHCNFSKVFMKHWMNVTIQTVLISYVLK